MALLRLIPVGQAYESEAKAREALDALLAAGFEEDNVSLITPSMIGRQGAKTSGTGGPSDDADSIATLAQLVFDVHDASRVPVGHAIRYAENLRQGRSLVLVTAPFGQAQRASDSLDGVEHVDMGPMPVPEHYTWDQAAPLSAWLRLPVLTRGRSWMASRYRELTEPDYLPTKKYLGGLLADDPTPLSSKLGMRTIGENEPAPLSSRLGMRLLRKGEPAPLSSKLGMRVLRKDDPTPLSRRLGMSVLSRERPAGEKYSFGLPLLLRDNPAPLSSFLGLSVIKRGDQRGDRRRDDETP